MVSNTGYAGNSNVPSAYFGVKLSYISGVRAHLAMLFMYLQSILPNIIEEYFVICMLIFRICALILTISRIGSNRKECKILTSQKFPAIRYVTCCVLPLLVAGVVVFVCTVCIT